MPLVYNYKTLNLTSSTFKVLTVGSKALNAAGALTYKHPDFNKLRSLKGSVITLSLVKTGFSDFKCLHLHSEAATFIMGPG